MLRKKKTLVKFQKKPYQQKSTPPSVEPHASYNSPFPTTQSWADFLKGRCPNHGKSEEGFIISGKNWYWCNICKRYTNDHNTSTHRQGFNYRQQYKPQVAAAKTVSQRAQPLPARANVASLPTTQTTPYIEEIDETLPTVEEVDYDFDTAEEEV